MAKSKKELYKKGKRFGDHLFYEFKSIDLIPTIRLEAYLARNFEFEDLRVKYLDLKAFCQVVKEYGDQGRFMDIIQLTGYLETLVDKPVTRHPMVYLTAPLLIMDGEDPEVIDPEFDEAKQKAALADPELESFFFGIMLSLKPGLKDSLQPGQRSVYLNPKRKILEEMFQQAISGNRITA